jgi:Mn2+/Fe2+ NRAMP family transporter
MAAVPKKLRFVLFGLGPKVNAIMAIVCEFLGLACLVPGLISAVSNKDVGMWSTEWFLITIALWIYGLWWWLTAYVAAKD